VDLLELDLLSGSARIYKSGASPTFLIRDGALQRLPAQSVPVGILPVPDVQVVRFDTKPGDLIVQVSDGVTQNAPVAGETDASGAAPAEGVRDGAEGEDCAWMAEIAELSGPAASTVRSSRAALERLLTRILDRARKEGSTDDLSVILTKVEEA
jgi:serine phosphatase RsbU (regulator of sigma subunit)